MLGIVASGIGVASLAIQIGDSVMKLKDFWNAVKEAPEEVNYLIEEIETLSLVLSEIGANGDNDDTAQIGSASSKKCLDLCRRGAEVLSTVVKEAEQEIAKKKRIGSVKMALKKGLVDSLRDRLKTVQFMLMLSNQTYSEALQRHRHELQRQWAELHQHELGRVRLALTRTTTRILYPHTYHMPSATSIPPIACEESSDESQEDKDLRISESSFQRQETALEQSHQQLPNAAKRLKRLMARLQVPAWFSLSSHAWEVCCYKAKSGWMFTAQAYRVVPDDSPIMKFARSGDVRGIQELFKKNMASPYDRRTGGETVLDVGAFNADLLSNSLLEPQANSGTNKRAAFYQHLEVCRLLLNEGADPSISSSSSALIQAHMGSQFSPRHAAYCDLVRCIAQEIECGALDNDQEFIYVGIPTAFEWLLNQSNIPGKLRTLQECFDVLTHAVLSYPQPSMASLVRVAFSRKQINWEISRLRDRKGSSLLHYAARYLGAHHFMSSRVYLADESLHNGFESELFDDVNFLRSRWNQFELGEGLLLVRDLLLADSYVCERNYWLHTPLLEVCHGILWVQGFFGAHPHLWLLNRLWLRVSVQRPEEAVRIWLQQLADAGLDLMEYGRRESRLHLKHRVKKEWDYNDPFWKSPTYGQTIFTLRLISFTYGPNPEDWQFWFTEAMDKSFLEFWHMVDHPEQGMPGAWNEYDNYCYDDVWFEDSEHDSSDYESSYYSDEEYESEDEDEDKGEDGDGDEDNDGDKNENYGNKDEDQYDGIDEA